MKLTNEAERQASVADTMQRTSGQVFERVWSIMGDPTMPEPGRVVRSFKHTSAAAEMLKAKRAA